MSDRTSLQYLDSAKVMVEFYYEPPERATRDHPDSQAIVSVSRLLINGEWIDSGYFSPATLSRLEHDIAEEVANES